MEEIEKIATGQNDRPVKDVVIADCGAIPLEKPFNIEKDW